MGHVHILALRPHREPLSFGRQSKLAQCLYCITQCNTVPSMISPRAPGLPALVAAGAPGLPVLIPPGAPKGEAIGP